MLEFFLKQFGLVSNKHAEIIMTLRAMNLQLAIINARLDSIESRLEKIEKQTNFNQYAESISFFAEIEGEIRKVESMFLKATQKLPLSIQIVDKFGNPAQVDGAPKWAVTDASLADIVAAADGLSAMVTPKGPLGAFQVQVSADADLGEGVKAILGSLDVEVLAGEATAVVIAPGAPQAV